MPYQNNIPQPADQISQSQTAILGNFAAIDTLVAINHVGFNLAGAGKHKEVAITQQVYVGPILGPATAATEGAFFVRDSIAAPGTNTLFYKPANKAAIDAAYEIGYALQAASGWTILPSGVIINWGSDTIPGGPQFLAVNFSKPFTAGCSPAVVISFNGNATGIYQNNILHTNTITNTSFWAVKADTAHHGSPAPFKYIAIGY